MIKSSLNSELIHYFYIFASVIICYENVFTKDYLEQLYRDGKAKSKKYRFPKGVVPKYRETIDKLRAADRIEDLYPIKSLNYEKLIGEKRGVESVRVNRQYRIEFISSVEGADECTIAICSIIELSKHYQ